MLRQFGIIWKSDSSQLRRDLQMVGAEFGRVDRHALRSQQGLGMWGRQLQAMSTTIRYSLSGGIIFGLTGAISKLSEFEAKLGDIVGLGIDLQRNTDLSSVADRIGNDALRLSNKFGTAVTDIQDQIAGFYSSFELQDPSSNKGLQTMTKFVDTAVALGRVTRASDFRQVADGLSAMVLTFSDSRMDMADRLAMAEKYANIIAKVEQTSVRLTGDDLSNAVGRIAPAALQANMSPEQAFGILTAATQAGGTPGVIVRGAERLIQDLVNPSTKDRRQAYRRLGLPTNPNQLFSMGGYNILTQMLERLRGTGLGNLNIPENVDETYISNLARSNPNLKLVTQIFPEVEQTRAFVRLLNQGPAAIEKFVQGLENTGDTLNERITAALDQSTLQIGANAARNMSLAFVRTLDPVLHPIAQGLADMSNVVINNPEEARNIAFGLIGGATAGSMARRFLPKKWGSVLGGLSDATAGAATQGFLAAEGMVSGSLLLGQGKGSRELPFWVIIHPNSWLLPGNSGGLGSVIGGGPGGTTIDIPTKSSRGFRFPNWFRGLGAAGALAFPPLLPILAGAALGEFLPNSALDDYDRPDSVYRAAAGFPNISRYLTNQTRKWSSLSQSDLFLANSRIAAMASGKWELGKISGDEAETIMRMVASNRSVVQLPNQAMIPSTYDISRLPVNRVGVTADGEVIVRLVPGTDLERWIKSQEGNTAAVPVKAWGGGTDNPTFRGDPETQPRTGR